MSTEPHQFRSGDRILLNDTPAEVITTYSVGDINYLRAYVEDVGVKAVCVDDVDDYDPEGSTSRSSTVLRPKR